MIDENYADELFQKFINNTLTKKEYRTLMNFLKNPESRERMEGIMDRHWKRIKISKLPKGRKEVDREMLYDLILRQIDSSGETVQQRRRTPFTIRTLYGVAATIAVIVGFFYVSQKGFFFERQPPSSKMVLDPNAITLQLDNGDIEVIREGGQRKIMDPNGNIIGLQSGGQLKYDNIENELKELVYNELTVPNGKRFDLALSDGTRIKLNSGSSIKYPIQFIAGKNREVFLKGEAYFDVAKDVAHPFLVNADEIHIKVLGTQFNVSHFPEDDNISTVLVEGSVELYGENKENTFDTPTLLLPGHLAVWNKVEKEITTGKVDTYKYIAWINGVLLFKNTPFSSIRKKLERHFNVSIDNRYQFLEDQVYTASFTSESIRDIMEAFREDTYFDYRIEDNKIIITKPSTN